MYGEGSSNNTSPFGDIKPLAPIRKINDTVTGSAVYSLDPFCPSNMEYQRRGEDELTKFIYKVVQSASAMELPLKFENPVNRTCDMTASEALRGPALDFRWQMKHLEYNRTLYCKEVFGKKIREGDLKTWTRSLREKADRVAHKQHLQDNLRIGKEGAEGKDGAMTAEEQGRKEPKVGGSTATQNLLDEMVNFTEKIYCSQKHKNIPVSCHGMRKWIVL